jgi:hypothetical protein
MSKRILCLFAIPALVCGCSGGTAPPDQPVTQAQISKMTPENKAGYNAAMLSRDRALAATQGKGPLATKSNGP